MDLYNFINHNTTGFLTNFLSEILKSPVKFIEYEERIQNSDDALTTHHKGSSLLKGNIFGRSGIKSDVKIFKFGLSGTLFDFIITSDNKIGFYFSDTRIPGSTSFYGSSLTNSNVESVRLNLLSMIREYKINQIIS